MNIEFYKLNDVYAHRYYKVPKDLFENGRYKYALNSDAKLLYALLLDRMELSKENGWVNERNEIYLIYTRDDLCEMLGLCRNTMTRAFRQLSDSGLIFERRQGRGLPNLIFIGKIQRADMKSPSPEDSSAQTYPQYPHNSQPQAGSVPLDSQNLRIRKRNICESRFPENANQEAQILSTRETDINEPEKSQSVSRVSFAADGLTGNLPSGPPELQAPEMPSACRNREIEELQSVIERCELHIFHEKSIRLMLQHALEIMWFSEFVKIGTARIPQCMVRSRMYSLHGAILGYALEKVKTKTENTVEIRNSTNYLITAIYNAITEYHSDAELDPGLNRYLNAGKTKTPDPLEGGYNNARINR